MSAPVHRIAKIAPVAEIYRPLHDFRRTLRNIVESVRKMDDIWAPE